MKSFSDIAFWILCGFVLAESGLLTKDRQGLVLLLLGGIVILGTLWDMVRK